MGGTLLPKLHWLCVRARLLVGPLRTRPMRALAPEARLFRPTMSPGEPALSLSKGTAENLPGRPVRSPHHFPKCAFPQRKLSCPELRAGEPGISPLRRGIPRHSTDRLLAPSIFRRETPPRSPQRREDHSAGPPS